MFRWHFLILVFVSVISGCAGKISEFPALNEEKASSTVLVGKFRSGEYLPQFSECGSVDGEVEVICMDPPPLLLKLEVVDVLFGEEIKAKSISVATTDHYGLVSYDFEEEKKYLIHLLTDGESFVMPRYHRYPLAVARRGQLVAPVWSENDIWFFPCSFHSIRTYIEFDRPPAGEHALLEDFNYWNYGKDSYDNEAKENPNLFSIFDAYVQPKMGYYLASLKQKLNETNPNMSEYHCELE